MSPIPPIQIPEIPASLSRPGSSNCTTPKTPRSLLKNLFGWRKTQSTHDKQSLVEADTYDAVRPQTSSSKQHYSDRERKPSFSTRSRSDTFVPQRSKTRSRSRKRSRSRVRVVWDPPPLFQAYTQAFMHDTLQIPTKGLLDWLPLSSAGRVNAKNLDTMDDDKDDTDLSHGSHHRSLSSSSTSSLSRRQFFLLENGHILQYKAEGTHDRLPERVVELSRDSVAFASDAIAGKHWVLEICPYGRADDESSSPSSKSPWPRMSFKAPENKRLAEKLLIIFESPENLFSWLIAIRKQIEGLGGMEYQPDMPTHSLAEQKRPTLRHASSEYFKRKSNRLPLSHSSSALPLEPDESSAQEKELPQLPNTLDYQHSVSARSVAASSVATRSSLDRLRESYSGSSTAGTALSSDVSAASLSPTRDCFPSMLGPILSRDISYRTAMDRSGLRSPTSPRNFSIKAPLPSDSPQITEKEPQTTRIVIIRDDDIETAQEAHGPRISLNSPVENQRIDVSSSDDRPQSILAPLPVPELRERLGQVQRMLNARNSDQPLQHTERHASQPSSYHSTKPSLSSSTKGSYGLFPQRLALDVKVEPLVIPDQNHVPGLLCTQATDHLHISPSPITPVAANFGNSIFARSNATFKRPTPLAVPEFLVPAEPEQDLRSPAVTDAMLDSNFGTTPSGAATAPSSPVDVCVPDFDNIKVDRTMFGSVNVIEGRTVSPSTSPKSRTVTPRRSMPNFHYGSGNLVTAPVGPPPSGPLPAVPSVDESWTNRSLPSSRRTSTQLPNTRRTSTKSTSATRTAPSNHNPTSPPPRIVTRNTSTHTKRTSPPQTRAASPISTASSSRKSSEVITTIGQVSIVSAPPRVSSLPQHKKSLSSSSVKSHKSRRSHLRTASGRSIQATLSHLSSITQKIAPSCAFELDPDQADRGCFSIGGTSR